MSPVKNRPTKTLRRKPGESRTYGHRTPIEQRQEEMRERSPMTGQTARGQQLRNANEQVRHIIDEAQLQASGMTPEQAQSILSDKVKASSIDPDTLQMLMAFTTLLGQELRKPSIKEEKKAAEEAKRLQEERLRAAEDGKRVTQQIVDFQSACNHMKDNGEHRWRGQVHSDGWAVVRCMACLVQYRVRVTPQMMQSGLNLDQIRGLTIGHIKAWAQNSQALDQRLKAAEAKMKELNLGANPGPMQMGEVQPLPI